MTTPCDAMLPVYSCPVSTTPRKKKEHTVRQVRLNNRMQSLVKPCSFFLGNQVKKDLQGR